jgi:hypothetical protein
MSPQLYRMNTDTCTHLLLNHNFINNLRTPVCFSRYERVIFRGYKEYTAAASINKMNCQL